MVVGEAAIQYVKDKVLSPYALMSPMEFFAELYAAVSREGEAGRVGREKLDPEVLEFMSRLGRRVERHESSRPLPSRVS
jgi:hypothetical protein